MEKRRLTCFLAAICAAALLCACAPQRAEETFLAMDTVMSVSVYGENAREAALACRAEIGRLEELMSVTDEQSAIYAINHAEGRPTQTGGELAQLLSRVLELCARTEGALDITIYPVVCAWGFTGGEYRVPSDEELAQLLSLVDYTAVSVSGETVALPAGAELDLGSAAKGYAGDRLAGLLTGMGVESAILDLGHNIQLIGAKPDGSNWAIAVQSPFGGDYAGVLSVSSCAVVTSGGYERCFTDGSGAVHHHIIDPATGRSADSGIASATIIGKSGLVCDALSTAVYVMGAEKAAELWRASDDFEMVLVLNDGSLAVTEGIAPAFTPADENAAVTVVTR